VEVAEPEVGPGGRERVVDQAGAVRTVGDGQDAARPESRGQAGGGEEPGRV